MLNYFLIPSCKFIGNTCLGAPSLSFNSGKFVRGFMKYCLNKMQLVLQPQSHSGKHPVWVAADRLLTMSLWMHIHFQQYWNIWVLCEFGWNGTALLLLWDSQKCHLRSLECIQSLLSYDLWNSLPINNCIVQRRTNSKDVVKEPDDTMSPKMDQGSGSSRGHSRPVRIMQNPQQYYGQQISNPRWSVGWTAWMSFTQKWAWSAMKSKGCLDLPLTIFVLFGVFLDSTES